MAAGMASGAETASDIVEDTLAAIAANKDPAIFTVVTGARARAEASAATLRIREGKPLSLLDGIPVAWKDLYAFEGETTRAGSAILDDGPAQADAELVRRLGMAGAVAVGKVNMTEFAFSGLGLNPHHGTPRNPWSGDEARIPGGSSSGSGVAVACGIVPVSIGTDTSGSVRIPAALNGVVGYKTSGERWPLAGAFPLSRTLDTAGVLSHTVADAVIVDAAVRQLAAPDLRRVAPKGVRVIVPENVVWDDVAPAVGRNFEVALARLQELGVVVERRSLRVFDDVSSLGSRHGLLVSIEAFQLHRERLATSSAKQMDVRVRQRLQAGGKIDPMSERAIREARPVLIGQMDAFFDGNTFIAFPTVSETAPLLAPLEQDDELFAKTNARMLRNTMIGSFLGWCGVSIPNGVDESGLPTAFLLSGGPGHDGALLSAAMGMEPAIRTG